MKICHLPLALTLTLASASVSAQQAQPIVRSGQTLFDVSGTRVGTIDRVNADGSIQVIVASGFVTIPAAAVVVKDGVVTTSLTKRAVAKMQ